MAIPLAAILLGDSGADGVEVFEGEVGSDGALIICHS